MNKRAIWIIVALMSAALLGITILQVKLLQSAKALKNEEFERNISGALNAVAEQLEEVEEARNSVYNNGYADLYNKQRLMEQRKSLLPPRLNELGFDIKIQEKGGIIGFDITSEYGKLLRERSVNIDDRPLGERVELELLDKSIHQELKDRFIYTDFSYGVFSRKRNCFIIEDGNYLFEDTSPKDFLPGHENLYTSPYRVSLFQQQGYLYLYFPNQAEFVRSQIWPNILGSVLFTLIIMFCFGYTVSVVFRQKKLSEMKNDFINNMTHEFKTPIATISLAADSINSPMIAGKADKVQRFANIIKQENRRMNSQVEKVLQMALLDKQDFSLKLERINLHTIINNAVENIGLQVERKDGKAFAELTANNPVVEGDPTHTSNVINNLLDNANKYSPEKPEISVHTRNVPNGVEVIVKDKGIGMTSEARKHIFDKFYRVHTGDLHDVKGFGLGLSYVKAMMTAHKGTIDVKSEVGKGSSFILFFPFKVS